jgi:hypothetical protein
MQKENSAYAKLMTMPDPVLQPERILWLHVVAQALIDVTSKRREIKEEVTDWMATEDFEIVCGMAGLSVLYMHNLFTSLASDRNKKRAFKKAMEFRFLLRTYVESNIGEVDKR